MANNLSEALQDAGVAHVMEKVREQRREEQQRAAHEDAEYRRPIRNWLIYPYAFEEINQGNFEKWTRILHSQYEWIEWTEAEEGVAEAIFSLACYANMKEAPRSRDITWLVIADARYKVLEARRLASRCDSIERLQVYDEEVFSSATSVQPLPVPAAKLRENAPPDVPGKAKRKWKSADTIIEALKAFEAKHGRVPRSEDCKKKENDLPRHGSIRQFFQSFSDAVIAAGMEPATHGYRQKRWGDREAASLLQSFKTHRGGYPPGGFYGTDPLLPSRPAMTKLAGGTKTHQVERWVNYVLCGEGTMLLPESQRQFLEEAPSTLEDLWGNGKGTVTKRLAELELIDYVPGSGALDGVQGKGKFPPKYAITAKGRLLLKRLAEESKLEP